MSMYRKLTTIAAVAALGFGLAACGGGGSDTSDAPPPMEAPDLGPAQMAAAAAAAAAGTAATAADAAADAAETAAMAADAAADAAEAAADAQTANMDADPGSYAVARKAAERARDAAEHAMADAVAAREAANAAETAKTAADTAKTNADDADTLAAAQAAATAAAMAQATAETEKDKADTAKAHTDTAQTEAEREQADAEMYAGMVADAQQAIDAEAQRVLDVADARMRAMTSYMEADADATKAEAQADAAEATAPGTPGAMAARAAATAARTAANAAKAAHDAIMDEMTKADADAQATEAATQASSANAGYMTAKAENDDIQTASGISNEQLRVRDVAAATTAAGAAATDARTAATNARTHATNARTAANAAKASYERAKSARTDSDEAKKQYEAADAAATAAENAATAAEMAADAAETAHTGIDAEGSAADAQAAQSTAEARQGDAETNAGTAYTQKGTAETARDDAMTASNTHVVGLLMTANAAHITTALDPDANRDETEVGLIERNRLAHVAVVNTAVSTANADINPADLATGTPHHGGGTVAASWHYYGDLGDDNIISDAAAVTSAAANADSEPGEGLPTFGVTPEGGGAVLNLVRAGPGADGQAGTDDDVSANFGEGLGLGAFGHEIYLDRYNDADNSDTVNTGDSYQRIILFSDLEQAKATVPARSVSLTNEPVSLAARVTPTAAPTTTGDDIHDFAGTYDHDGNPDTDPIAGTFDCVDPTTCRVTRSGTGNNGEHVAGQTMVTSISGYRFTGTGTTAEVLSMLDDTWLAFGVWLTETVADGTNTYVFGAFADGGAAIGDTGEPAAVASVTGDATYTGKAAGVHSTATEVEFFHADAMLNAEFGDGTEVGTITGMIHNIVSGGDPVTGNIELVVADPGAANPTPNIADAGTFGGRARMHDTGEDDSSGEDIYRYTGGWSGTFYNHMANVATTADVDESTRAPGSVAGTFGVGRADVMSTMDVDEAESYVGAFGAHCSGSNCNPH